MNGGNFNIKAHKKRVLVAPLDWGLGHATRCIPLIRELEEQGATVIIAAEGIQQNLLKNEFPALQFIDLKGYRVHYAKSAAGLAGAILLQTPGLLWAIRRENRWLKKVVTRLKIDAVISDNRYGLYHKDIPCIFMTHQLAIQTGSGFLNRIIQKINYRYINAFSACWVPDNSGNNNLAGKLSQPGRLPSIPVRYIGTLSRLYKMSVAPAYDLCILISGPEPQRSIFETTILDQLRHYNGRAILLRGLPGASALPGEYPGLEIADHLPATELNRVLMASQMIICRSGYSSIMDLVKLEKKAILIPTPGQKEQEYLADILMKKHFFFSTPQKNFSLAAALQNAAHYPFVTSGRTNENFSGAIADLLNDQ